MTTTRRNLLRIGTTAAAYAAGATIVTGGVALASQGKGATLSPSLAVLFQRHKDAEAAQAHAYATTVNPAFAERKKAKERHQQLVDAVPHAEASGGISVGGTPILFSSRKAVSRGNAAYYLELDAKNSNRGGDWADTIAAARSFLAADYARNEAIRTLGEGPDFSDLFALEQKVNAPFLDACQAIYDFPCVTTADLAAKVAWIEEQEGTDSEIPLALVMADLKRITAQEGR